MKKTMSMFSAKVFLPMAVTALIMVSCASNDTNPATQTGTDTSTLHMDTAVADHTNVVMPDTSAVLHPDTTTRTTVDSSKRISNDTASKANTGSKPKS